MTARTLVTCITVPVSQLPSLKSRLLRIALQAVVIGTVTLLSVFIGTILSAVLLTGVES